MGETERARGRGAAKEDPEEGARPVGFYAVVDADDAGEGGGDQGGGGAARKPGEKARLRRGGGDFERGRDAEEGEAAPRKGRIARCPGRFSLAD